MREQVVAARAVQDRRLAETDVLRNGTGERLRTSLNELTFTPEKLRSA